MSKIGVQIIAQNKCMRRSDRIIILNNTINQQSQTFAFRWGIRFLRGLLSLLKNS